MTFGIKNFCNNDPYKYHSIKNLCVRIYNQNIWFLLWSLEIKQAQNNTIKGCVNNFIGQFCSIYAHATSTIIIKLHFPMKNTISNFPKECWNAGGGHLMQKWV